MIGPFISGTDTDGDPFLVSAAHVAGLLVNNEGTVVILTTSHIHISVAAGDGETSADTLLRWSDLLRLAAESSQGATP